MKIDSVRFKNINSLKGEWEIKFNQPPLVDAGVFAITGPNGSGKTSILDAITLGLYGETFKFDHPAAHVMTKHTDESYSEVIFSMGDEQFRSNWSVKKTDGKLTSPEMKIVRLNGSEEELAKQPSKVRSQMAELTGMDFRRFTRTVMLAQGDFAAFLNALDNERLDILEKIISTDIYSDVKRNVLDKDEKEKGILEELKDDLAAIPMMEPEKLEACEHDLIDFQGQLQEYEEEKLHLQQQQGLIGELRSKEEIVSTLESEEKEKQSESDFLQAKISRIESVTEIAALQTEVEALGEKEQTVNEGKNTLESYRHEIKQLENSLSQLGGDSLVLSADREGLPVSEQIQKLESLKTQMGQLQSASQSEAGQLEALAQQIEEKEKVQQTVRNWLQEHDADKILMESFPDVGKLKKIRTELASVKENQQINIKKGKDAASLLKKNQVILNKRQKDIERLIHEKKAQENELANLVQGKTPEGIEELKMDQQERVQQFQNLLDLAVIHGKLDKKQGGWRSWFEAEHEVTEDQKHEYERLLEQLEQEKNIMAALDKAVEMEAQLRKHTEDRKKLVDGEPCPLCGALEHPFAKRMPIESDSRKAVEAQKVKLETLKKNAGALAGKIKTVQNQKQEKTEKEQQKQDAVSQWASLCTRLNIVSDEFEISNIKLMKKMLADEKAELKSIDSFSKNFRLKKAKIEKNTQQLNKLKVEVEQLNASNKQLNEDWKKSPQEIKDLEESLTRCLEEEKTMAHEVVEQLTVLGEKMPSSGKEDKLYERLNQRLQDYQTYLKRQQDLQGEIADMQTSVEKLRSKKDELTTQLVHCQTELQSGEVAALHLSLVEKQKMAEEKEKFIAGQQVELTSIRNAVQEKAIEKGLRDVEEAREIINLKLQRPEIEQDIAKLGQQAEQVKAELKKNREELETLRSSAMIDLSQEEIAIRQKENDTKTSITLQEIDHTESILAEQSGYREQNETLQKQIEEQQSVCSECEEEAKTLAVDNATAFRQNVQKLLVEQLLSSSNQVLEKISGRYFIRQTEKEQGLSLEIEDSAQNNIRRLPKTLSGGESFVVSLALALGLSEMANNGKSVDSLFLDEGFGTLDEETLYIVLTTLENLHRSGKRVGVISHVKELKDRIRTQIQMSKQQNGISSLEIVA